MKDTDTFIEVLVRSIKATVNFTPVEETPPAAILWPDGEGDWEPLIPRLRRYLPVLTLGPYNPTERSGPVAWLRCILAQVLEDRLAPNAIPVLYLPGVGAQVLCDGQTTNRNVERLAELRFRSVLWLHPEGREWTVAEFFQDAAHGCGIQMRENDYTRRAMRRVLPALGTLTVAQLRAEEPWKAKDFEGLVGARIEDVIRMGESAELEFKSSARWDMNQGKASPTPEQMIAKTVGGFLNSTRGGTLLIGVEDNHNVCGLEVDYQTFAEKDRNADAYERWLTKLLLNTYGPEFLAFIQISFHVVEGKTVCKLLVEPAPNPAFAKIRKDEEHFYLRTGNATNTLPFSDFLSYYKTRWR